MVTVLCYVCVGAGATDGHSAVLCCVGTGATDGHSAVLCLCRCRCH